MENAEAKIDIVDIPEISEIKKASFVTRDPNTAYLCACGDDRCLTRGSCAALEAQGIETPDVAVRYFGATIGLARIAALTILQQHGREALETYGGNFENFVSDAVKRIQDRNKVTLGLHSAAGNEGIDDVLNPQSEKGLGCAYAALLGAISELNSNDSVIATGRSELTSLTGEEIEQQFQNIVTANGNFTDIFSIDPSAGITREQFRSLGLPVGILEGSHKTVKGNNVRSVLNFTSDKLANAYEANKTNEPYYCNDVTIAAEMLLRAYPEFKLQPRTLLDTMIQDIAATRQALAASEELSAADIASEKYGTYDEAVRYLESLEIDS